MNEKVVVVFSCNYSAAVLEETCRRLAERDRTIATRRRRQVAAPTATMLSLIFTSSSLHNNQPNAPRLQSMVSSILLQSI